MIRKRHRNMNIGINLICHQLTLFWCLNFHWHTGGNQCDKRSNSSDFNPHYPRKPFVRMRGMAFYFRKTWIDIHLPFLREYSI